MIQAIFEDVDGRPQPIWPLDSDGNQIQADGVKYLDTTQAASLFNVSASTLAEKFRSRYAAILGDSPIAAPAGVKPVAVQLTEGALHGLFYSHLSAEQFAEFVAICKHRKLNPWARQVFVKLRHNYDTNRPEIIVSPTIDGLRLIADRTKRYAGCDAPVFEYGDKTLPLKAEVRVFKIVRRERVPYVGVAFWDEFNPDETSGEKQSEFWTKMPHRMLGKCAEADALRKAFPQELGGLYAPEELDRNIRTPRRGGSTPAGPPPAHADETTPESMDGLRLRLINLGADRKQIDEAIVPRIAMKYPGLRENLSSFIATAIRDVTADPGLFGIVA